MRHSDPKLTANIYQAPRLLDVAGAVELLPDFPLDGGADQNGSTAESATGTDGRAAGWLAPMLAPRTVDSCQSQTFPSNDTPDTVEFANVKKRENPRGNGCFSGILQERAKGFEPSTYSLGSYPLNLADFAQNSWY